MVELGIPRLVLASASPRRTELLSVAGFPHRVAVSHVAELRQPGESPVAYVRRLAAEKARAVSADPDEVVLGADTTVVVDGEVLEKPSDLPDAARMLGLLSGRSHEVVTGICLRRGHMEVVDSETTNVFFQSISRSDIEYYIRSGEPLDKAGAYGIQGLASKFIHRIEGCYFNVVGLPVSLVWRRLREFEP